MVKIYNSTQNNIISEHVDIAQNFFSRSIGLISKKEFKTGEALIIKPCCSIHTFFMKFDIDVLFVNKQHKIIAIYEKVKPNKVLPIHLSSSYVVEMPEGSIKELNIHKQDELKIAPE